MNRRGFMGSLGLGAVAAIIPTSTTSALDGIDLPSLEREAQAAIADRRCDVHVWRGEGWDGKPLVNLRVQSRTSSHGCSICVSVGGVSAPAILDRVKAEAQWGADTVAHTRETGWFIRHGKDRSYWKNERTGAVRLLDFRNTARPA